MSRLFAPLFIFALVSSLVQASDGFDVGPGDVLQISVWEEPELTREVLVLPDSTISFPLVGVLGVSKLSVGEISEKLTTALSEFIPNVALNVAVSQLGSTNVYVLGKVNRPGPVNMTQSLTVFQVLSVAGGLNQFADRDGIRVIRKQADGSQTIIDFDYDEASKPSGVDQNISLLAGDVVFVP